VHALAALLAISSYLISLPVIDGQRARAENFPFCTIDPNVGKVWVPDPRLDTLAALANSKRTLPCQMVRAASSHLPTRWPDALLSS
jgi:hypothetical protein